MGATVTTKVEADNNDEGVDNMTIPMTSVGTTILPLDNDDVFTTTRLTMIVTITQTITVVIIPPMTTEGTLATQTITDASTSEETDTNDEKSAIITTTTVTTP